MDADALADRLFANSRAALEMFGVYLGEQLGYYRALTTPATSAELAERTGTNERYAREWLEQQAAVGFLTYTEGRFELPEEHARVLADEDDVHYGVPGAIQVARGARRLPNLIEAYRTGTAPPPLPWEPEGRAEANRNRFRHHLGTEWLPSISDVHKRLSEGARVADIACGLGASSIAMAQAYPLIEVDGVDLDEQAIAAARANAERAGVADRVRFRELTGAYDLVTIFEALHDMSDPVDVLHQARNCLSPNGCVIVGDMRVAEEFNPPTSPREQYAYGCSVIACLPASMGGAATGAVIRPGTVRKYADEAGFASTEILPIDTPYWRFYRLQ